MTETSLGSLIENPFKTFSNINLTFWMRRVRDSPLKQVLLNLNTPASSINMNLIWVKWQRKLNLENKNWISLRIECIYLQPAKRKDSLLKNGLKSKKKNFFKKETSLMKTWMILSPKCNRNFKLPRRKLVLVVKTLSNSIYYMISLK